MEAADLQTLSLLQLQLDLLVPPLTSILLLVTAPRSRRPRICTGYRCLPAALVGCLETCRANTSELPDLKVQEAPPEPPDEAERVGNLLGQLSECVSLDFR